MPTLCCAALHCVTTRHAVLCCALPCCATTRHAVLCHAVLCCAALPYVTLGDAELLAITMAKDYAGLYAGLWPAITSKQYGASYEGHALLCMAVSV